jgi:hypothetical protein
MSTYNGADVPVEEVFDRYTHSQKGMTKVCILSSDSWRVLAVKQILWCVIAILMGSYICLPVADPDLWWHITVGRWIIAHGTVPRIDYWNMFGVDLPWRAYSWTSEIVVALVDRWFGDIGLLYTQLGLGILLAAVLQYTFGKIARDNWVGAAFGIYSTVACYNHFTLRPQVVVWIFFAVLLYLVEQVSRDGLRRNLVFGIFVSGAVWANTHLTAALGLGAVALWLLPAQRSDLLPWKNLAVCVATFFLGTLCTPYLGGEWITFLSKTGHPLRYSVIAEFQPATILQYSTVFVLLLLVFLIVVAFTTRAVPRFGRTVLGGGMVIAGLTAVKFLPFAAIVLGALVCQWWSSVSPHIKGDGEEITPGIPEGLLRAKAWSSSLSPMTHGALAFLLFAVSLANISSLRKHPIDLTYVPKAAVDYIKEKSLQIPILNEFGSGGYLMYRFSSQEGMPEFRVAIDGRTNVNPPDIWQMYQESFLGKLGWRKFIQRVEPKTILWRQGSAFVALLYASKQWCRVFSSGEKESDYVIFVQREEFERRPGEFSSNNCSDG